MNQLAPFPRRTLSLGRSTLPLLAALASVASAQDLLTGGPHSLIDLAHAVSGPFQNVGACGGAVQSMAASGDTVYIGDRTGVIYLHSPSTGVVYAFDSGNDATALAVHQNELMVGGSDGSVRRFALPTFAPLGVLQAARPIDAMVVAQGALFVAGPLGTIERIPLGSGGSFLDWSELGVPIRSLSADDAGVIAGTPGGVVYRVSLGAAVAQRSFGLESDCTAMQMHLGHLLVGDSSGSVRRVDPVTGDVHDIRSVGREVQALAVTELAEPGWTYCYGLGCPCGNDDVTAGCANSTGRGTWLQATGTTSVTADDLMLVATSMPPNQLGLFIMGPSGSFSATGDGILCVNVNSPVQPAQRFPIVQAGMGGMSVLDGTVAHSAQHFVPAGQIQVGSTWDFQLWYRDPAGPCGQVLNTSNSILITFTP